MAFIYRITNLINGKKYIGETNLKDPLKRWISHQHAIREGRGCPLLRKAIQKHGVENFKFEVICECTSDERYEREIEYIASENSITPNGYNVLKGGPGGSFVGKKHSAETIAKMRDATLKTYREMSEEDREKRKLLRKNKLVRISEEARKKLSIANTGKKLSEETKRKISEKIKLQGKMPEEVRKKISIAAIKRADAGNTFKYTEEMKKTHSEVMTRVRGIKVDKYTLEGAFVCSYNTISIASKENGTSNKQIKKVLNNQAKDAGGFLWKLHTPAEPIESDSPQETTS